MFLLTPEDVEITSVQHPKRNKEVPILSYDDKTFRLLRVFSAEQYAEAHTSWRELTEQEGKLCVLLEEPFRYSIWRQVRIDLGLLRPTAPVAYAKACVVMIQSLYGDAEQLLGSKQAKSFGGAVEANMTKQMAAAGGLGGVLRLDPLADVMPQWEEDDLSALLLELHRLGTKFFGRSKFMGRTLAALDDLAPNDKAVFLNWLKISLLGKLWLPS
ncbi:MAG: Npun_F0813 family protein [Phormidesmis sp.]